MLKQILRDMYVDPEILAGLDETYKQTLFCKMREEQIRRWKIWDEEQQNKQNKFESLSENSRKINDNNTNRNNNNINNSEENINVKMKKKNVSFRLGLNGEPWVWVMGEHPDDSTIEQILEEEAKQKARQLAENEFRKSVIEGNLTDILLVDDCTKTKNILDDSDMVETPKIEDLEIYCSVDELKDRMMMKPNNNQSNNNNLNEQNNYNSRISNVTYSKCNQLHHKIDVLQEISYNKPIQKVSARIALWEQRTIGQRTSEIFKQIQKRKQEAAKEAEEAAKREEELWKEQERKAKQAEIQMREIARRAREEHRKSLSCDDEQQMNNNNSNNYSNSSSSSLDSSLISRPPNQDAVINWYRNVELPKNIGINSITRKPEKWFHGLLTRTEAERLLNNEEQGTFLVRLSEKIWGYAISYRDMDRCKHYLVDASSNSKYKFIGQNQLEHNSLYDLLRHHTNVPITILGNELLLRPCPSTVTISSIFKDFVQ